MRQSTIGIVIGGGDAPGLNTVMTSLIKSLPDCRVLGFRKSFDGLLEKDYIELTREDTSAMRWIGGTMLKTVNKGRFGAKVSNGQLAALDPELLAQTKKSYDELGLDCLFVLGGDATLSTATQMQAVGMNIIGIPKSIDNDVCNTDYTFGFQTAVEIVNESLQRLHTTATSHDRVMVLEVMGRHTGWIALHGGIAGGANIILLPEMPFSYDAIVKTLEARHARGRTSHLIVVAEGASFCDGHKVIKNDGSTAAEVIYGGIGEAITAYLNKNTSFEARNNQLGHIQRGGSPVAFDLLLSDLYGSYAALLYQQRQFNTVVSYKNNAMQTITFPEAVNELKKVDPQGQTVMLAKGLGISFGE